MSTSGSDSCDSPVLTELPLGRLVAGLRGVRGQRPEARAGHQELPSREALARVVEGLRAALFPHHFGPRSLSEAGVDYFVGHTLDVTFHGLREQVLLELQAFPREEGGGSPQEKAARLVGTFALRLPELLGLLERDVRAAYEGDPAARTVDEILFCYPGINAILHHRIAHEIYTLGAPVLGRILAELAHAATGIDIHPGARIGGSFFIDHGTGVVIGETARIGERVRLYQGVTLGAKSFPRDEHGILVKGLPRHPTLEDDVVVYAGATILGSVTVGRGASIGGNVWLTHSVPPGSVITQARSRSEQFEDGAGI